MLSLGARRVLTIAVTAALALTGCSSSTSGSANKGNDQPFLVYFNGGFTSPVASVAQAQLDGVNAAAEEINNTGGILGHQVKVITADDQLDPVKAVQLMQQQLDKEKPNLVFHGQISTQALAMLPLLTRNKVLSNGAGQSEALNDPGKYPYNFGPTPQNASDARALVVQLDKRKAKRISFVVGNDAFGQSVIKEYEPVLKGAGIDVTFEQYDVASLDFSSLIQRVQADRPDVAVLNTPTGAAAGRVLVARTQAGMTIPALGTTALGNGNNLALVSGPSDWKNVEELIWPANTEQFKQNAGSKALLSRLKLDKSKLDQLFTFYSLRWDMLYLAKYAAEQANSIGAPEMAKALENLKSVPNSMLTTFPSEKFSASNHFFIVDNPDDFYTTTKPGDVVEGFVKPGLKK